MIEYFTRDGMPITEDVFVRQCEACLGHDTADRVGEIRHPTLIVCGEQDRLTPISLHRQLAEAIPDAHLVAISYGAHMVMVESAEHFNRIVLQFVTDGR
jgi:aminoacrylate hydrolase